MTGQTAKFVSQKMSKVRWRTNPKQTVHFSEIFATGSWDDEVQNSVNLWTLEANDQNESDSMIGGNDEPRQLCSFSHQGDVMDLQFITSNHLLTASSNGTVQLLKHHDISQTLSMVHGWDKLHHLKHSSCACNSLATRGEESVVSVGEDGRIFVLNIEQRSPVRSIEKADSCSINDVSFMRQFEIATVNSMGQLKVWDIRQQSEEPARILHMTGSQVPLHCLDKHPTQPHILVTGSQEGSLSIWDMRQDRVPVALLTASESEMWEVRFHPSQPDNLLTCHGNGSVFLWNASAVNAPLLTLGQKGGNTTIGSKPVSGDHVSSPWLACDAAKNKLDITELLCSNGMPVNSIDIVDTTLLCATDGEQILTLRGVPVK